MGQSWSLESEHKANYLALTPSPYLAFCHLQQANGKLWSKNKANLASFPGSLLTLPFFFFVGARGEPGNEAKANSKAMVVYGEHFLRTITYSSPSVLSTL